MNEAATGRGYEKALAAAYFPHPVAQAVSSALRRFTSVFGMGTGGAASLWPPGTLFAYLGGSEAGD